MIFIIPYSAERFNDFVPSRLVLTILKK